MPKKYNWDKVLDTAWRITKISFAITLVCLLAYGYGTFKPNKWAKDIYDNYTEKQAETIFKKVEKLKPHLTFYQSKLESFKDEDGKEWGGYDYYAKKI